LVRYPDYFAPETITFENYKWLYIHLQSRAFGRSIQYISLVPIAELFNHENTGVHSAFVKKEGDLPAVDDDFNSDTEYCTSDEDEVSEDSEEESPKVEKVSPPSVKYSVSQTKLINFVTSNIDFTSYYGAFVVA
jgi:hypothetical protein